MEQLLAETIAAAQRQQALKPSELRRVNVDTTVQEKAIAFPTDARLYHKARCVLVREAKRVGLGLRQSYRRVGKRALQKQGRYAHAQQLRSLNRLSRLELSSYFAARDSTVGFTPIEAAPNKYRISSALPAFFDLQ